MSYNLKKIQKLKRITAKKKTIVEQISHPPKLDGVVFRRNKIIIFVIKSPQISAKLNIFWVEEEIEDSLAVIFLFVLKQTFVVNLQRSHAKNSFLPYLMDLTPWSGLANKFVTFRFFFAEMESKFSCKLCVHKLCMAGKDYCVVPYLFRRLIFQ